MTQQQTNENPATGSNESIIFGIFDRLYDHGHAAVDVVLAPAKPDGSPDWESADPANVELLPEDEWPADENIAKRACVVVSNVDGCDPESTFILIREDGRSGFAQIHGPACDRPIAEHIVARDIGAKPPEREPSPLAESIAKLFSEKPVLQADNQNDQKFGKFIVTRFRDLGKSRPKPFVVKGVRSAGEASYTVAKPGGGKSVIETDIAYHVATGRDWHGRKVEQGLAVYIAAERKALQDRRVMALRKHFDDEGVDVPLVVIGGKPNLTDDKRVDALAMVRLIKALEAEYGLPCRHVTIDTLARSFGGKNQNATEDMSKFVHNIDILMESLPTAHINIVHHEGWETGRAKGSIDLDGAVDVSFQVRKANGVYTLACDGANDGVEGDVLSFTMQSVSLGTDDDGESITAPVVVRSAGVASTMAEKALTTQALAEKEAMEDLAELSAGGHPVGGGMWQSKYQERYPDANVHTIASRWKRAVRALEKADRVTSSGSPKVFRSVEVQDAGATEVHALN